MDREGMEGKMLSEMKDVAGKLTKGASGSLQDMAGMERKIYGAMNGLKAKLLQSWADEAKDDTDRLRQRRIRTVAGSCVKSNGCPSSAYAKGGK